MDQGPGNSEERGRLGRQGEDADRSGAGGGGFRERSSSGREHPPEQYPGGRRPDYSESGANRYDEERSSDRWSSERRDPYSSGHSQQQARSGGTGWGIAALVLGVLALLGSIFGLFNFILAVPALILGIVARRKGAKGLGLTAIILAILAVLLGIALTVLAGIVLSSPEFQQLLQEAQQQGVGR